jgi:hypothetical protein
MCYVWTDTATPTKQNVTDRELDPTKPQSTGNDKFKTQLSTETLTLVTINIEGFHAIRYISKLYQTGPISFFDKNIGYTHLKNTSSMTSYQITYV